jgi:hypothetical protein
MAPELCSSGNVDLASDLEIIGKLISEPATSEVRISFSRGVQFAEVWPPTPVR